MSGEFNWFIFSREAAVIWAVGHSPGSSLSQLSKMLGLNYVTLRGCVRRLCAAGLLKMGSSGRSFRVFLTGEGRMLSQKISAALSAVNCSAETRNDVGGEKVIELGGRLHQVSVKVSVSPKPSDWNGISEATLSFLSVAFRDEALLKAASERGVIQARLTVDLRGVKSHPSQIAGILSHAVKDSLEKIRRSRA